MALDNPSDTLKDIISRLEKLEEIGHKNILELPEIPALAMTDTIMLVTDTDYTGRASLESLMQYLNENLKNFICWKPVVSSTTLSWERSANDQAPNSIDFSDMVLPMASETTNGMMTKEDYSKLLSIDSDNIVYLTKLNEELEKKAPSVHTHEQYQLIDEMPSKLSQFNNDTNFITAEDIPTKISAFENDIKYITADSAPSVSDKQRGFMTPELLEILNTINGDYIKSEDLEFTKENIIFNLPKNVSAFNNDMEYVTQSNLIDSFGELGSINLINDSQFKYVAENFAWEINNGTIEAEEDADYGTVGKITMTNGTSVLTNIVKSTLGSNYVISFVAKASIPATLKIAFGGVEKTVSVSEAYQKFKIKITRDSSSYSHNINFSFDNSSDQEIILYMTNVKVERGSILTDFSYSSEDINKLSDHAAMNKYGLVKPDGVSLVIDEETGELKINMYSIIGPVLNDKTPSYEATFTSKHITELLGDKADLVDGKVPSSQLPSYVDDIIEGTMNVNCTVFTISPGQNSEGDPSTGKIYVDTNTNLGYRWTGSGYTLIGEKYVHPDVAGFKHLPAGGESGQILGWNSDGEAKWVSYIYMTDVITLPMSGWNTETKSQTIHINIDTDCKNIVEASADSLQEWLIRGVIAMEEYSDRILFKCDTIPTKDLKFTITSVNLALKASTDDAIITGIPDVNAVETEEIIYGEYTDLTEST